MDLGKYADTVLRSYLGAIGLIAVLIGQSLWQAAKIRAALRAAEIRSGKTDG